jgi:hypothetical protein
VLRRTVQLNKHPFIIIGVAPPGVRAGVVFLSGFFCADRNQVEGQNSLNARGSRSLFMTRLSDGARQRGWCLALVACRPGEATQHCLIVPAQAAFVLLATFTAILVTANVAVIRGIWVSL